MDKQKLKTLSKYGVVKTCKLVHPNVATIVITGFNTNAMNTFEFINDCTELFPEHPILETCITEDNLAIVVLKSKNQ